MIQHVLGLLFLLIIMAGPLPLCVWIVWKLRTGDKGFSFSHELLVILTSWCIIETSIGLLLGLFGYLKFHFVLLIEIVIFLSAIISLVFIKRKNPSVIWLSFWRLHTELSYQEKLVLGVIGFMGIVLLLNFLTCPITETDSLNYHLPVMTNWYQTGSLAKLEPLIEHQYYPYNWEMLCVLFLMPFKEDFLVCSPNLIAWGIMGLCVYLLSIRIGAKKIYALAASSLILMLPLVLRNAKTMHIDLAFGAFFLAATYFMIHSVEKRSFYHLLLFFSTLGMLLGIKSSGIVYATVLMLVLVFVLFKALCSEKEIMTIPKPPMLDRFVGVCWGGFSFFLLGGFWYLKNFIEVGNPLGFVKVQIGKVLIFPGSRELSYLHKTTLANLFELTDISHWKIFWGEIERKLDVPFWAILLSVFLLLLIPFVGKRPIRKTIVLIIILFAITLWLYWTTPYSGDNDTHGWKITSWIGQAIRYGFPFIGILGVLASAGLTIFQVKSSAIVGVVLISAFPGLAEMVGSLRDSWWNKKILYMVVLLLLVWGVARIQTVKKKRSFVSILCLGLTALALTITFIARENRDDKRDRIFGGVVKYIEDNIGRNETIGFMLSYHSYLFYGKRLNQKVINIPVEERNLPQWLAMLRQKNIDVIAIGPLSYWEMRKIWESAQERSWLNDPNGSFTKIFGEDPKIGPMIFRFKDNGKNRSRNSKKTGSEY